MKNNKLVLIASFPGSILSFRGALIQEIQTQGYQVHVIAPRMEKTLLIALQAQLVVVHQVDLQRTGLNPFTDARTLFQIYKLLKNIEPEFVMSYTIKPVIYGSLAAKLANVKHTFSLITGLGYAFTGRAKGKRKVIQRILHFLYKLALNTNTVVFFQNKDDQQLFQQLGLTCNTQRVSIVNGSGININEFQPVALPQTTDFLLIARLLGDKGVREYAKAAKMLNESHPTATCRLVGFVDDNPDSIHESELQSWVDGGYIDFLGRLDDVKPAITQSAVYVLPSYREGTPRSVLEAMAMGRPIITTDAPGCRETVVNGVNGFLIPVKDSLAIYNKMIQFIEDKPLTEVMGAKSREIAEQKFDVHKVNDVMLKEMGIKS
jgi:glycosyltransferase involved in cell wall biosynthesis